VKWPCAIAEYLKKMLQCARYAETSVVAQQDFFSTFVAPMLGPSIDERSQEASWKSFMTDSHTPIELSWSWSASAKLPQVRYSVDPIPRFCSKENNVCNMEATRAFFRKSASSISGLKTDLYDFMLSELYIDPRNAATKDSPDTTNIPGSQQFLGFDLTNHEVALKAYFLPQRRALQSGTSALDLINSSMKQITYFDSGLENAWKVTLEYLSLDSTVHLETEIIAIDCAETRKSRIKIYFRTRDTSLSSVLSVMTLGGRLPALSPEHEFSLRELWRSVLDLRSDEQNVHKASHRTAGILYYLEFRFGTRLPKPKLYIPVRHYSTNDYRIARGLSEYLGKRGKGFKNGTTYLQGVQRI
jgi:DMATS type aromatic prenyltransferase